MINILGTCSKRLLTEREIIDALTPVFARIKSGDIIEILEQPDWCRDCARYVFRLNERTEHTPIPSALYDKLSHYNMGAILTVTNVTRSLIMRDGRRWIRLDYEFKEQFKSL